MICTWKFRLNHRTVPKAWTQELERYPKFWVKETAIIGPLLGSQLESRGQSRRISDYFPKNCEHHHETSMFFFNMTLHSKLSTLNFFTDKQKNPCLLRAEQIWPFSEMTLILSTHLPAAMADPQTCLHTYNGDKRRNRVQKQTKRSLRKMFLIAPFFQIIW